MHRHPTGPLANLLIVAVATLLFFVERRQGKRAQILNRSGRCARCKSVLLEPGHRVPIAGGPRVVWRGFVCERCYAVMRLQGRIVWSLVAAAGMATLGILWLAAHAP